MADPSQRPLKRQRKVTDVPNDLHSSASSQQVSLPPPQPVDHIFIADGLLNKKPGGKKVSSTAISSEHIVLTRLPRPHFLAVNVVGEYRLRF